MRRRLVRDGLVASLLAVVGLLVSVALIPNAAAVTPEGWVALGLSALVFYLFTDHLVYASWDYAERRDARRFRGLMIGLLLAAGTLGILMGSVARYVPEMAEVARFVRWITIGMLFVGGITTWITWRVDGE